LDIQALEVRQQLFEFIEKFPGLHFRELQRRLEMPVGSLQYHLGQLEKEKLVIVKKDGEYSRYYPVGLISERERFLLKHLRHKQMRRVCLLLLQKKKASHKQIAEYIGLSPATTSWYLSKMLESGLVTKNKRGRQSYYSLKNPKEILKIIVAYKQSFLDKVVDRFIEMWEK